MLKMSFFQRMRQMKFLQNQMIHNASDIIPFLTAMDCGMQEQAYLTEQLWLNASNVSQGIIGSIWMKNYTVSFDRIQKAMSLLKNISGSETTISILGTIALSICQSKIDRVSVQQKNCSEIQQAYIEADRYLNQVNTRWDLFCFSIYLILVIISSKLDQRFNRALSFLKLTHHH